MNSKPAADGVPAADPRKALLEFSAGCNTDCLFCLRNEIRSKEPAPKAVDFERLSSFLALVRRLGLSRIELGGDEPLVLPLETVGGVIAACRRARFEEIRLVSNGVALGREGAARQIVDLGVDVFILPIYGPDGEIHDAVTQRKGSFAAVKSAALALAACGDKARVIMHTIPLRQNERHMSRMVSLVEGWGLKLQVAKLRQEAPHVDYAPLKPLGRIKPVPGPLWGDHVKIRYNVLSGEINRDVERDSLSALLRDVLKGLGMPVSLLRSVLGRIEKKPGFGDPARILSLLELAAAGSFGDFEFELLGCSSPSEALELGRRRLAAGRRAEALRALREALRFRADGGPAAAAMRQALRIIRGFRPGEGKAS